jgi:hypothetical protein
MLQPRRAALSAILIASLSPMRWIAAQESTPQPTPQLPVFHVTSVDSEPANDLCGSGRSCSSGPYSVEGTKYTVKGYIDSADKTTRTVYKLECVELRQTLPSPKQMNYCERVHAGREYKVSVLDRAIVIGGVHASSNTEPGETAYHIVSEREVESGPPP